AVIMASPRDTEPGFSCQPVPLHWLCHWECTFLARKPGCGGLHITTDACWGRCETWEKPVLDPPCIESYKRVCTYNETRLVTVQLPNCSANHGPHVHLPCSPEV
ncbi:unnamed protein product, partial [Coregonus sp. 'balchen']